MCNVEACMAKPEENLHVDGVCCEVHGCWNAKHCYITVILSQCHFAATDVFLLKQHCKLKRKWDAALFDLIYYIAVIEWDSSVADKNNYRMENWLHF